MKRLCPAVLMAMGIAASAAAQTPVTIRFVADPEQESR